MAYGRAKNNPDPIWRCIVYQGPCQYHSPYQSLEQTKTRAPMASLAINIGRAEINYPRACPHKQTISIRSTRIR